jgi:NADPH:quinone reductase-like Zn-dependent oxidoreductase
MSTMRAAVIDRYGSPDVFRIAEVPRPSPGPGDVLVRVIATSVNPVDCKQRQGIQRAVIRKNMPAILGMDVSGVVEQVGAGVTDFAVGDAVWSSPAHKRPGTYAEYVCVEQEFVALKPPSISHAEAASLPLVALTAWDCFVTAAKLGPGQRVLIQAGSGGVGTIAIQIAKHLGAEVITTCSAANAQMVSALGADRVIDYRSENFAEVLDGLDVVLESMGPTVWSDALKVVGPGGHVTAIATGFPSAAKRWGPWLAPIVVGWTLLTGVLGARLRGKRLSPVIRRASGANLAKIGEMVEAGTLRPVIDRTFPLSELAEAHRYSETGRARGKIVIEVD